MQMQMQMDYYVHTAWIAYGVGPTVCAALGFIVPWVILSALEAAGAFRESDYIQYRQVPREIDAAKTFKKVPYSVQLVTTFKQITVPHGVFNAAISAFLMPYFMKEPESTWPRSSGLLTFVALQIVGDLFLYLGHRVQHENEWLWKNCHSMHHQLATPSLVGTAYIHPLDVTLQTSIPILLAGIVTQAHPITFAIYTFMRVAENTVNHSGLDCTFVNIATLKFLPGRASTRHHDQHHRFSNYGRNAKNYGENFIIFDWLFQTLRK